MDKEESQGSTPVNYEQRSPEEIREDIEQSREELGDTVADVADKADIKKQAKSKVGGIKEQAGAKADTAKQKATAKKDEIAGKAKQAAPESAEAAAQQAQQFAQENPVPLAIAGAFIAGFAVAKLLSR
jgi:ElaB/YqjD/DUF883 family membrane-anchored ribosome-binding protein